jgi:hypothetical protein
MSFCSAARKPERVIGKENAIIKMEFTDNSALNTLGIVGYCLPSNYTVGLS